MPAKPRTKLRSQLDMLELAWDVWSAGHDRPSGIARRQHARLRALLAFAWKHSPFYRNLFAGLPLDSADLAAVPPVTRRQLMANFDTVVTDPGLTRAGVEAFVGDRELIGQPYLGRYRVWTSSGSTAEPRIFVHDEEALAVYRAMSLVRGWLPWMRLGRLWPVLRARDRVASVVGSGGHFPSSLMLQHQRQHRPWPFDQLKVFSAQLPVPELVRQLNVFQPAELIGYPSVLTILAQEQTAGRLAIRPALVGSGGEWLGTESRRLIESAFRCPVRENYAASEFPQAVWDCLEHRLHVGSDWLILEPVDERYAPVPPGQVSHTTLVTNLANRVMPIIRYDVGDRITVYPDRCRCGSPLPSILVEGRRDDTLSMRRPDGEIVRLIPIAIGMAMNLTPGMRRFQLIQVGPTSLSLRLEIEPAADRALVWETAVRRLRGHLAAQSLTEIQIMQSPDPPGVDPRSGKFRRIWSALGDAPAS